MQATVMQHTDVLSHAELRALLELPAGPCASLFMPISRAEPARQQNPLRLEQLLRRAEERLLARGLGLPAAQHLLSPGYQLVKDQTFWARQADGLALFAATELFRVCRLPLAFEELAVVNDHAHIIPLLPLLSDDGRFYLLTVGLGGAQLFEGSRYGLSPLPLEGVPASLREALASDEFTKEPQLHAGIPGRGGERGAIFHGQGAKDDTAVKQETARYFRQVDHGVRHALGDARRPLLLAGIASLLPIYQEVNSYPHLADDVISVNPDTLGPEELYRQAWALVARQLERARDGVVARYRALRGSSPARATGYLRAILPAAFEGRIESLLVARGQQRWGSFNPENGELTVRAGEPVAHDSELLNLAVAQTFLHGGSVYLVAPEQVAEAAPLAAIFRY